MRGILARDRDGFALLAVLWVITGVAVLALGAMHVSRNALATVQNRTDMIRATWHAEDCLARARAVTAEVVTHRAADPFGHEMGWAELDLVLASSWLLRVPDCDVVATPVGRTLDVNAADGEALRRLFEALSTPPERIDSIVDALLDWRDEDTLPRVHGAERDWYLEHGRHPPRDGPFADPRELRRVRGLESIAGLDTLLGVEPGRISLRHAPAPVLASIPGFGEEAVRQVLQLRELRNGSVTLPAVLAGLSSEARGRLEARYADAVRRTASEPEGWIVVATGRSGTPPLTVAIEVKILRAGTRAAVVRRRIWLV